MYRGEKMNEITPHHIENVKKVQQAITDYNTITDLSDFFKILGDSTRLQILMALEHAELCVSDIAYLLNMTVSAVSHQLKSLKTAKLVKLRRDGKSIYYALDDDHINKLLSVSLEHIEEK